MERREFVLTGASVVGATSIGSVAFTTASVNRDVTIDVVKDTEAAIELVPGKTNVVQLDSDGALVIDTNRNGGSGLNGNGNFTYGNTTSTTVKQDAGVGEYAFSITNNGAGTGRIDGTGSGSAGAEASFTISLSDGPMTLDLLGQNNVPGGGSTSGVSLSSGDTVFADLTINTSTFDKSDTINQTLTIEADPSQ